MGLTYFRYPKGSIDLFGQTFSLALGVGMAVLSGSLVAELIHSYVFPHIHALDKLSEPISALMSGASNSVGAVSARPPSVHMSRKSTCVTAGCWLRCFVARSAALASPCKL